MANKKRGIIIAGNWKMNHSPHEAELFFKGFSQHFDKTPFTPKLRGVIFPPMCSIERSVRATLASEIEIGAQNVHWEKSGAFTGEISGPMAKEIGVKVALVGHSERRQYFGETDETVRKRTESLLNQDFDVMVCVGETREEREGKKTGEVIRRQLKLIQPLVENAHAKLSIAYEPVWAIGTGLTATPQQAQKVHELIRELTSTITPILYGGSVTPKNIDSLLACLDIDGALVGGASLNYGSFAALIESARKALV